ncbi:Uncharacterised protein [Candidatus Tiddalikarchaeum anstoanum]|nr:Uncharacterised protein [Candidatus Tiddalikarchaeum anstoanum]
MVRIIKPKKRVIFYWFFDKGFFFIITSLLVLGTYLRYFTNYYLPTLFILQMVIVTVMFSLLLLVYEWFATEYYLLEDHVLIKDLDKTRMIRYSDIKDVGYYGNLLQHLMGTTNVAIRTRDDHDHYLRGISDYKSVEDEILRKITRP